MAAEHPCHSVEQAKDSWVQCSAEQTDPDPREPRGLAPMP